ncbi:MAG: SpoIIE family protein phosphatase, partial [Ardenticatenaceae bacterium]
LPEILATITRLAPALVEVDAAAIYLWNGEEQLFEGVASHGLEERVAQALKGYRLTPEQFPLLSEIKEQQELITIDKAASSRLVPGLVTEYTGEIGLIAVALAARGDFVGVLLLGRYDGLRRLSKRRTMLVFGIAQQAAVAIQAARLFAAQQEEAAITSDLLKVAEMIAGRTAIAEVLELVTRLTVTMAEVKHCVVYLWDGERDALLPAEAFGFSPEVDAAWREAPLAARDVGCLTLLWDATEPLLLGEGGHPIGCPALEALFEGKTLAAMPLRAHGGFMGVLIVDLLRPRQRLDPRLRTTLTGIARQLSVTLEHEILHEEVLENERRSQELAFARRIQSALLPDRAPELPGYDIAGYWRPAREVAGDFYDYLRLSQGRVAFSIADVADKGMGAALFMVLTRTALRESLWSEEEAGRALGRTNAIISEDVRGGMFLTLFLAILSPESGHFQAANAGHLPPIHYRAEKDALSTVARRNLPVGINSDTAYDSFEFFLEPGDMLVL